METLAEFRNRIKAVLDQIDKEALSYNEDEYWMIRSSYESMEYYADKNRLYNTAIALPLARGLHNGTYRRLTVRRGGKEYRPPYVIHCLKVCILLADTWLPLKPRELDVLLAAALCHDMIEDLDFKKGGRELYEDFGMDKEVYEIVKIVSKKPDPTHEEELEYYRGIMENKLALLIKLSDRNHNVTDLYNMSEKKIHEYIGETRNHYLSMCEYGRENYPELSDVIEMLQSQLIFLTKTVEMTAEKYGYRQQELRHELESLREDNALLHRSLEKIRKEAGLC